MLFNRSFGGPRRIQVIFNSLFVIRKIKNKRSLCFRMDAGIMIARNVIN